MKDENRSFLPKLLKERPEESRAFHHAPIPFMIYYRMGNGESSERK
jgi:hypothetical protein